MEALVSLASTKHSSKLEHRLGNGNPVVVASSALRFIGGGRNLVASRPLSSSSAIADRSKRLIVNHIGMNARNRSDNQRFFNLTGEEAVPTEARSSGTIPVYKANDLGVGSNHVVYCSFAQDGPHLFSVQLKNQEHILDNMMTNLANVQLRNLTHKPSIGMACIARYSEDRGFYRAAIVNIQPKVCRVTYIDYGNSEDVAFTDIFEVPDKFLEHKIFAIQFSLSGTKQIEPIDDRLKEYFSNLVRDAELELKVMPLDGPMFVQYCDLFYKNRNVLDMLKDKMLEFNSYPNPRQLTDGDQVIIRYVENVNSFFVQRTADCLKFDAMMDKLLVHCKLMEPMDKLPKMGLCCAALHVGDENEYYRVEVLQAMDNNRVRVVYVDYGQVAVLPLDQLKRISPEFMTLPRQINECCLVEFETNANISDNTRKQLEMMAEDRNNERKKFRVEVRDRTPKAVYVVNLYDDKETPPLNVSASLYKLSMPRKNYGNSSKFTKGAYNTDYVNSTVISDANTTKGNSSTWSEITAADEQHVSVSNSEQANSSASNKSTGWTSSRNTSGTDGVRNGGGFDNNTQRDAEDKRRQMRPSAATNDWDPQAMDKRDRNVRTRSDNWAQAEKADTRGPRGAKPNNWIRENPEGGQRIQRDASDNNWRTEEQGGANNR